MEKETKITIEREDGVVDTIEAGQYFIVAEKRYEKDGNERAMYSIKSGIAKSAECAVEFYLTLLSTLDEMEGKDFSLILAKSMLQNPQFREEVRKATFTSEDE